MSSWVAFSVPAALSAKIWTAVTYSIMHAGPGHLFFNGLAYFFIGRWLYREIEPKRFLQVILASVVMGAIAWLTIQLLFGGGRAVPLVGFSAAVAGMVTLVCLIAPDRKITLLLFFVLPVEARPRIILFCLLGFESLGFLFLELAPMLSDRPAESAVAFSAHLGGMLAGYLYYRMLKSPVPVFESVRKKVSIEPPKWTKKGASNAGKYKVNVSSRKDLRKEVDRILDKINRDGFGALSEEEKRILDQAGELLKK